MRGLKAFCERHGRRLAAGVLIVGCVSYGTFWFFDGGKRMFFPRKFAVVSEGLYRSGQIHRRLIERVLVDHEIDLVVDLAKDIRGDRDAAAEREVTARLGIPMVQFRGLNGSGGGDPQQYVDALSAIVEARAAGENVLVHCAAGAQRVGTLVSLYRMLYEGWEGPRTYEEYLSYRKDIPDEPNVSRYVSENYAEVARGLQERGLLSDASPLPSGFGPAALAAVGAPSAP